MHLTNHIYDTSVSSESFVQFERCYFFQFRSYLAHALINVFHYDFARNLALAKVINSPMILRVWIPENASTEAQSFLEIFVKPNIFYSHWPIRIAEKHSDWECSLSDPSWR